MQQMPSYNKRFLYYSEYAKADMNNIFGEKLNAAQHYTASQMSSVLLENTGTGFKEHLLPMQAQWYPIYNINVLDVNGDGKKDLIVGGNQAYARIKFGAYSSGKGDVLINKGNLSFERLSPAQSGISISGDIRNSIAIGQQLIFGINNQRPLRYRFNK